MKIGWDAKRAFLNQTGLGVYSRHVIEGFVANYYNKSLFLFTPKISTPKFLEKVNDCHIVHPVSLFSKVFHAIWRWIGIGYLANKYNLDIYHGLSGELPVGMAKKTKKIVTVHDILFERFPDDYPLIDRLMYSWKTKYAIRKADKVICVSEATSEDLIQYYHLDANKIQVIPNTFRATTLAKSPKNSITSRPFILFVSTYLPRKNQGLLLSAYESIADKVSYDLILIGSGRNYYAKIKSKIKQSLFKDRIHCIEFVEEEELIWYYQKALFSVYPSQYEGFGIPILESIFHYCPVLVSDIKPFRDIAGNLAYYFESNNVVSLANQLLYLHTIDNTLTPDYITDRKALVKKYDPHTIHLQLMDLYTSMVYEA